jgi:hypothetical protein
MTNNFNLIRPLLTFENDGDFYFLQILKRRKDNPGMVGDSQTIDNIYIYSIDTFNNLEEKIIKMCQDNNARAYIRLNKRNNKKVAMTVLKKTVDLISCGDYKAIKNVYESACGLSHSDEQKKWIIDIDVKELDPLDLEKEVRTFIYDLQPFTGDKVIVKLPTKNGYHLITTPFRLDKFKKQFPTIDVHKDNPSILYCL